MSSVRQRARTPEQKQARKNAIVQAARQLMNESSIDEITIAALADCSGLARGTAYTYFTSKEALFLSVMESDLRQWVDDLTVQVEAMNAEDVRDALPAIIGESLWHHPRLLDLMATLHATLETRASEGDIRQFKLALADITRPFAALLEAKCQLAEGAGYSFLLTANALAIGLGQMAKPTPRVAAVIDTEPALHRFKIDFEQQFTQTLHSVMQSL
ncbi:MAG: TetR family transcriptional regulator [Halioglobus sp.]